MNMYDIVRGDIFYVSQDSNNFSSDPKPGRPAVIVSNDDFNKYSPNVEIVFLTSQEKKPLPTHVKIMAKVPSTALCESIRTIPKSSLGDFVKSCNTTEMKNIDNALLVSLGLSEMEMDTASTSTITDSSIAIERNLYKSLYEQLLNKITGGE